MIQSITIENIKCGGCVNSIKSALMKISGVEEVQIDKEIVTIYGIVERDSLIQTLSKLGYPEKGNNDLFKKTKSFVSCAIGRMNNG